jgi:hypothetical protein
MSTSATIINRRHANPVVPPDEIRPGERFIDPSTGQHYELDYQRPGAGGDDIAVSAFPILPSGRVSSRRQYLYLDPSQLVNLEGRTR